MTYTFRDRLRQATRPSHQAIDTLMSGLDLADRVDFTRFCRIHLACFTTLARQSGLDAATADLLRRASAALADDLAVLGADQAGLTADLPGPVDPLAVAYIIGGSRLGSQVLKSRWSQSACPHVRGANTYFTMPAEALYWRSVCDDLAGMAADDPRGAGIMADTDRIFRMFAQAFHQTAPHSLSGVEV